MANTAQNVCQYQNITDRERMTEALDSMLTEELAGFRQNTSRQRQLTSDLWNMFQWGQQDKVE